MRLPLTLLALATSCCTTLAVDLKGRVQWNELCPSLGDLGQAKAILDDGRLHGGITRDGSFEIPDVSPGTYILNVVSHDYQFDKLRVDVFETESLPEIRPYIPGTPLSPPSSVTLPYPILLTPRVKNDYFIPRQSFNLMGMFQSPMMLMMLVMGGVMLAMPYILKTMDPDALQDFNKRQARIGALQSSLQSGDLSGGLSALMTSGQEESSASTGAAKQATPSSSVKQRGGKNRRR
ncbi:uncharacterized protein C8Q71DRAFT_762844 [Rhodofomes roseus]|uniref:ER membrane protein complex subunit 7 beta-sandwich domain-containing protein n=2 Tax=Rhodofomes roseus TaxID=34475 RepID=A0ABQ8KDF1_9APHY|nr:uncharacterized protein C8Q71DRAFT_762844 [Rhodofomes roseus]KAH9835628.1 hypothetical protein C8Q71DRAFT_762844 [Rhodofomes roseus]